MNIFVTSDQHHGHAHVIRYCNRPFNSLDEMNETLITNHNSVVKSGDSVYHLGDFAFKTPEVFLRRLNGRHILIKGNHDDRKKCENAGFAWVKDVYGLKVDKKYYFWLSHYAHRAWNKSNHGSFHCFGHSHGNMPDYGRSCDVGVDCWNYFPVSLEEVVSRLSDKDCVDHHCVDIFGEGLNDDFGNSWPNYCHECKTKGVMEVVRPGKIQ